MNMLRSIILAVCIAGMSFLDCSGSVGPESSQNSIIQVPGCKSGQIAKLSAVSDSCLTYVFRDVLYVDFCAFANCCPDSNRFSFKHSIDRDTILVTIADTAAHLCRCNCTYYLHAEFHDLPGERYVFVCQRMDYSSRVVLYSAVVQRQ
jgi:hypothetical protein